MGLRKICLIGLGEVGGIVAEDLLALGFDEIAAFDFQFDAPDAKAHANIARLKLRRGADAADAARGAELIISMVTASAATDAAASVSSAIAPGAFYLDLNSCSPDAKARGAAIIESAGGRYVEGVVMSPILPKRLGAPMLLGGPHAEAFLSAGAGLKMNAKPASEIVGVASATKLSRSVIVKGMEAIITEAMLTARHYGVEKAVLASLSDLFPNQDWDAMARYMIARSIEHGVRRAEEMEEAAITVEKAGVPPLMASATAERQRRTAACKDALTAQDLGALIDAMRAKL